MTKNPKYMVNRKKILLIVVLPLVLIILVAAGCVANMINIWPWDYAYNLSEQTDTIEVYYMSIACPCAQWSIMANGVPEAPEKTIYLESGMPGIDVESLELEGGCWPMQLKLVGRFYKDEGISRDFGHSGEVKPDAAQVFRYIAFEVQKMGCPPVLEEVI